MAELLLTMFLGWYGFGLLAGLVLLGAQLVGRARRGAAPAEGAAPGPTRAPAAPRNTGPVVPRPGAAEVRPAGRR